jgi:hypothetical protein
MHQSFEARITDAVAISALDGHRRLLAGRYRVSVHYDERGGIAGAELTRVDVQGPPWPIRLTLAQWLLLDGTGYFERCDGGRPAPTGKAARGG